MKWKARGMVLSAAILVTLPAHVRAETNEPRLVVRTYNNYKIPERILEAARQSAGAIFRGAGIQVTWVDCWFGNREALDAARCRQPLASQEIVLRLQNAPRQPNTDHLWMGFSVVNLGSGSPFLATVFADRVASVAQATQIGFPSLLGRVIAHEIGHLLLDRSGHAENGLMRAHWSRSDLQQKRSTDWVFRDEEVAAIQAAAERRNMRPTRLFAMD